MNLGSPITDTLHLSRSILVECEIKSTFRCDMLLSQHEADDQGIYYLSQWLMVSVVPNRDRYSHGFLYWWKSSSQINVWWYIFIIINMGFHWWWLWVTAYNSLGVHKWHYTDVTAGALVYHYVIHWCNRWGTGLSLCQTVDVSTVNLSTSTTILILFHIIILLNTLLGHDFHFQL